MTVRLWGLDYGELIVGLCFIVTPHSIYSLCERIHFKLLDPVVMPSMIVLLTGTSQWHGCMCRSKCNFAYVGFVGVCYWVMHFVSFINQLLTQSFCKGKSFASLHDELLSGLYVCVCYVWSRFVSCACLFFPLQIMIVSCLEEH